MSIADQAYTGSVYIKNIGSKPVRFYTQLGPGVTVNPGEWTRAIISVIGDGVTWFQLRFEALNADDDLDFIAWGPQAEHKPFATSFVDGTRANGRLGYEQFPEGPFTVAVWGKTFDSRAVYRMPFGKWNRFYYSVNPSNKLLLSWVDSTSAQRTASGSITIDPLDWHFYVLTWDGTTLIGYVDGDEHVRATPDMANPGGTFGWGNLSGDGGAYTWNGLLDEGLILPYAASEDEIRSWYEAQAPFYDPDDVAYTAGRVERHEATLQVHAGQIASKVERTEFDQLSGRVSQAETAIQQKADQIVVTAIDNRLRTAEQNISGLVVTAQEISTAVANVQDGLTQAQSAIQQNADQIALRVQAVNQETGEPVQATIQVSIVDGVPYALLDAQKVLVPGTLIADLIQAGTLTLSGSLKIVAGTGMTMDHEGLKGSDGTQQTFFLNAATGDAFFKGQVTAKRLIVPIESA